MDESLKPCKNCGKPHKNAKYCSHECSYAGRRVSREVSCSQCGTKFVANRHNLRFAPNFYCSDVCRLAARSTSVVKTCALEECGKEFVVPPSAMSRRKYCSRECYGKSKSVKHTTTCEHCGSEFECKPYKKRKYCSRECRAKAVRKYDNCSVCGKRVWKRELKYGVCSEKCRRKKKKDSMSQCQWCGDMFKGYSEEFCCISCARMHRSYGHVDLTKLSYPLVEVYTHPDSPPIWLPLSASELEILLHLHSLGMTLPEITKNVKRWREIRNACKKSGKPASLKATAITPVSSL